MASVSGRKKLLLFPPMQTYPSSLVQIAAGGITSSSFAPGAIDAAAINVDALDAIAAAVWAEAVRTITGMANGAVTALSFAAGAIDAAAIAADAIGASEFSQAAADKVWGSASRTLTGTVTVATNNDKTGYSLTAGSYSVRASSCQRGTVSLTSGGGTLTVDLTISSITTTRGSQAGTNGASTNQLYSQIVGSTTVRFTRNVDTGAAAAACEVWELF